MRDLKCHACGEDATLLYAGPGKLFACALHWTGSKVDWQAVPTVQLIKGSLLDAMHQIEAKLPILLTAARVWNSLDVNYEPPHVERLWHQYDDNYRLYLHRIHPCNEALFHPHPWPSAVHILSGSYEMGIGYGEGSKQPPVAATLTLRGGSEYEMIEPNGWHYVRPLAGPSLSIMVTGQPWQRWSPSPSTKLGPLKAEVFAELLESFRSFFRP